MADKYARCDNHVETEILSICCGAGGIENAEMFCAKCREATGWQESCAECGEIINENVEVA